LFKVDLDALTEVTEGESASAKEHFDLKLYSFKFDRTRF
jgi:hypothetical protein